MSPCGVAVARPRRATTTARRRSRAVRLASAVPPRRDVCLIRLSELEAGRAYRQAITTALRRIVRLERLDADLSTALEAHRQALAALGIGVPPPHER
jgi:hypothetical protein